ncbi:hypothetical protein FRC20_003550, partial [Serendipita sp. 405]
ARSISKASPEHEATFERGERPEQNEAVERIAGDADDETTSREPRLRAALTWDSTLSLLQYIVEGDELGRKEAIPMSQS